MSPLWILFPTVNHIASAQSERNHWPDDFVLDAGMCPLEDIQHRTVAEEKRPLW
jgi:hypothetical protein